MSRLFNFQTLSIALVKETTTLTITLNRPKEKNALSFLMISELEEILSWASTHLEISNILVKSSTKFFSMGADPSELKELTADKVGIFFERVRRLCYGMFFLPQTIIFDLGSGVSGIACELALGADIRIAHSTSAVHFNHLHKGHLPMCGGIGFLSALFGNGIARSIVLSSTPLNSERLLETGFLFSLYDNQDEVEDILVAIYEQAPVQRIQAKRALLESILPSLDRALKFEGEIGVAGLLTDDYKNSTFRSAKDFSMILKKEKDETILS